MDARFMYLCVLSSVGFSWPLIVRYFGVPGPWIALTVSVGSAAVTIFGLGNGGGSVPSTKLILAGLAAGALNGIGMVCYGKLLGTPNADMSTIVPVVSGMVQVFIFSGSCLVLGEPVTARKLFGVVAIVFGIYQVSQR